MAGFHLEPASDREALIPILLGADESEQVLRAYLYDGDLFRVVVDGAEVGAVLLISVEDGLERRNLALAEAHRGRGLGRATIEAVADLARRRGAIRLVLGTAESSVGAIAFYRSIGFVDAGRIEGFFDGYPEPVVENGIVAHDMVRFEMPL